MPRINRAIRRRANQGFDLACSRAQMLRWGAVLVPDGEGFANPAEELRCWSEHRAELMSTCPAGTRPYAYFIHDLKIADFSYTWWTQLHALMDRMLISPEEALRIETLRRELSPAAITYCAAFEEDNDMAIERIPRDLESKLLICGRWHAWRQRPELAEKFLFRAASVRSAIDGVAA